MNKNMNKKGFTLVELLATIIILSIVTGISIVAILTSLENAKKKTEEEYLNQLSMAVDDYLAMCLGGLYSNRDNCKLLTSFSESVSNFIYRGCDPSNMSVECSGLGVKPVTTKEKRNGKIVYVYGYVEMSNFVQVLGENIITSNDLIDPVNNKSCKDGSMIRFYIDEDYVNYYEIILPIDCVKYEHEKWSISNDKKYIILNTLGVTNSISGTLPISSGPIAKPAEKDSDNEIQLDEPLVEHKVFEEAK